MFKQYLFGTSKVVKILAMSFVFCAGFGFVTARSPLKSLATLDERINYAQKAFEDVYYELVKQGFFDTFYNNNLVLRTKIDEKFILEGEPFLKLIDWLDKRNDRDSRYLLKKLSKYLYLEFYRVLCVVDVQRKKEEMINYRGTLLCVFKDLYKSKQAAPCGIIAPFRAVLSEMIAFVFMINLVKQPYEKKREIMAYKLHQIENKLLLINADFLEKRVDDKTIKNFIQDLQVYITKEPVIKTSMIRGVMMTSIVIMCLAGVGFTTWKYVLPNWAGVKNWMDKASANCLEVIGEGISKGVFKGFWVSLQENRDKVPWVIRPPARAPDPAPDPEVDHLY